jgi:hypothetical protein
MIKNPFLLPPQVEGPQSQSWGRGFAFGFQGPPASVPRPADIDPEVSDAFDQGVLVGQQTAIDGFPVASACMDLGEEPPTPADLVPFGFETALTIVEIVRNGLIAGAGSGILAIIDLCVGATVHFHDPAEAVGGKAGELAGVLAGMGITDSMELFLGGGVDMNVSKCELKLTPVFRSLPSARSAAQALGRPQFVVVSWRTDASGSVALADAG